MHQLSAKLSKHKLDETSVGLIKLLDLEKLESVAIAVIMKYGNKYPDVVEHAEKNAARYEKSYKHFSIPYMAAMQKSMQKSMSKPNE